MIALAQAYSDSYSDSLSYSSDEVQAAYDADPKSYQSADIEYILFTSAAGDDATDEEKAELLEQASRRPRPLSPAMRRVRRSTPSARIWKAPTRTSAMLKTALPIC